MMHVGEVGWGIAREGEHYSESKNELLLNLTVMSLSGVSGSDDSFLNFSSKSRKSAPSYFSDLRIAVFGNSDASKPGDWLQPMASNFPSIASSTSSSSSSSTKASRIDVGICRNVVTSLHVEVAFAYAGAFNNPQVGDGPSLFEVVSELIRNFAT